MKPLTEKDEHDLEIDTQLEGYKDIPRYRKFKVFYKKDVLSVVALLKKDFHRVFDNVMTEACRLTIDEIIDSCFKFKEQGDAKERNKRVGFSSETLCNTPFDFSQQEFPVLFYCKNCNQMTNHKVWRGFKSCLKCKSKPSKETKEAKK
jgi:hypothetical protein